jgi:hypothetical protein
MSFIYFVETDRAAIRSDDAPTIKNPGGYPIGAGPGGKAGLLLYPFDWPHRRARYIPEEQAWLQVSTDPPRWVGYYRDDKPTPESLRRADVDCVPGEFYRLDDGNDWEIPEIMMPTGESMGLPSSLSLVDGRLHRTPVEKFLPLAKQARRAFLLFWATLTGQEQPENPISDVELLGLAMDALAVNYRIGRDEVGALGLITDRNFLGVLSKLVGINKALDAREGK